MSQETYCTKSQPCRYCGETVSVGERINFVRICTPVHQSGSGRYAGDRISWKVQHWDTRICYRNDFAKTLARENAQLDSLSAMLPEDARESFAKYREARIAELNAKHREQIAQLSSIIEK